MVDYAIAIRTLGTAGEKYKKLLNSIRNLKDKPKKVVVVMPIGYELPQEKLGYEEFVFVEKSMIMQRMKALEYIDTKYVLFCDDDVEFEENFVEKLIQPLEKNNYAVSAGPLESFWPPNTFKYKLASVLGGACVMLFNKKNNYIRILKTGGWSYNYNYKKYNLCETQSLPWTCFMIKTDAARSIHMEDDLWLEMFGYAAFDDRTMFYKLLLNGYSSCVVTNANYIHNDAKTSTQNISNSVIYSRAFNHIIFWHRYIYSFDNLPIKIFDSLCILYYVFINTVHNLFLFILKKQSFNNLKLVVLGFVNAFKFIFSKEYKNLNPVIKRRV